MHMNSSLKSEDAFRRNRPTALLVIAVALLGFGIYADSYVPALLVEPPELLLLIGFILQAVCALAAAIGVWRDARWAAGAVVLLGICVAGTSLCEAFILGIVAYMHALLVSIVALVIAICIAAYLARRRITVRE